MSEIEFTLQYVALQILQLFFQLIARRPSVNNDHPSDTDAATKVLDMKMITEAIALVKESQNEGVITAAFQLFSCLAEYSPGKHMFRGFSD